MTIGTVYRTHERYGQAYLLGTVKRTFPNGQNPMLALTGRGFPLMVAKGN